jgi:polysaccharide export outer membrane protein
VRAADRRKARGTGAVRRSPRWLLALAGLVALAGCAARPLLPPPPDPNPMDRQPYVIGVTDVIRVSVWKNQELSVQVPVRPDGKISVPLLDDLQAEGLTPEELKEVITRELGEYVVSPDVTVIVAQMNSRFVSVIGGVARTVRVPLTKDMRVLEAITVAGGFTTFADKGDVRIVRRASDGSEVEYRFDYDEYVKGRAPGTNIVLQNGDMIIVPD